MKPMDSEKDRNEMVEMHNKYIKHLENAIKEKQYIEASWLCYSIFEQRINRLIKKHLKNCPKEKKVNGYPVAISTRINCIMELIKSKYGGYEKFELNLFERIKEWCDKRNKLVHDLVNLERYKKYDLEFKNLALEGVPLVKELYEEMNVYRKWWYNIEKIEDQFPKFKCKCKKQRCIKE